MVVAGMGVTGVMTVKSCIGVFESRVVTGVTVVTDPGGTTGRGTNEDANEDADVMGGMTMLCAPDPP